MLPLVKNYKVTNSDGLLVVPEDENTFSFLCSNNTNFAQTYNLATKIKDKEQDHFIMKVMSIILFL